MKNLILLLSLSLVLIGTVDAKYEILADPISVGSPPTKPESGLAFSLITTTKASKPCPDMTTTQRDALTPKVVGSCVYNTTTVSTEFWNGTSWIKAGSSAVLALWTTGTAYGVGAFVYTPTDFKLYIANTSHTAGATFAGDIANWDEASDDIDTIASSTDNGIVRFDGTAGGTIQDSGVLIDDSDNLSGVVNLTATGTSTFDTALTGWAKLTSGVLSAQTSIDLTTDVGATVLPIANGGTNSSSALANDLVMISNTGSVIESATTATQLSYVDATSSIQTQLDAKMDEVASTDNAVVRFDGITGSVQDSGLIIDDTDNLSGIINLTATGTTTLNTGLTGFLKAASGVVSAQAILDLTTDVGTTILPIANGGTGSATRNFVDLTSTESVGGVKTFTSPVINTAISGTAVLDEDTMSSDSATQIATQQSIKAYVDASSVSFTTVTKTTTATLATTAEDNVLVDATTADFTVTLPAASGNSGLTYKITKSTAANLVTIEGNASETIGGELNVVMASKDDSIIITTNGTSWFYLSDDITYAARYTSNSGQVVNSSGSASVVEYEDLVTDAHNAYNTTTGEYTVPVDGWYNIKAQYGMAADDAEIITIYIYVDSSQTQRMATIAARTTTHYNSVSADIYLTKDQVVDIRAFHSSGSPSPVLSTTTSDNSFSIVREK